MRIELRIAAKKRKKKLTLVDKANVLETSRLWRRKVTEISTSYPEVIFECLYIDNAVVQMMINPTSFDVILTENMFGDILASQGSVLVGSIGLLPSASIGIDNAMFAPFHGSYMNLHLTSTMLMENGRLKEKVFRLILKLYKTLNWF